MGRTRYWVSCIKVGAGLTIWWKVFVLKRFVQIVCHLAYLSKPVALLLRMLIKSLFNKWLVSVSGTLCDLDFGGSLEPVFISWCS